MTLPGNPINKKYLPKTIKTGIEYLQKEKNYVISRHLGVGSYGSVFMGRKLYHRNLVAIKVLFCKTEESNAEAKYWQLFSHPNIIKLHCRIETDKHIFYVMELASISWHEMIQTWWHNTSNKASEPNTRLQRFWSWELVDAIRYLHYNRFYHLDIKPDNLVINDANHTKVTDFGLMRRQMDLGPMDVGAFEFRPPEALQKTLPRSLNLEMVDAWSVGATLLEFTTGLKIASKNFTYNNQNMAKLKKNIFVNIEVLQEKKPEDRLDVELALMFMKIDPSDRWSMERGIKHPYFSGHIKG